MLYSTQETLSFPPVEGLTVRGHFDGGALSSDFGPMILRGIDRQIGLTDRLAEAFKDRRHPGLVQKRLLLGNLGKRNPPLIFQEGKDFAERMGGT